MSAITRKIFDVEYDFDTGPREFRVRITMADTLKAEAYGPSYGVLDATAQPQLVGIVWLWLASLREGHVPDSTTFEEFRERCLDNGRVGSEPVDPTRPGADAAALSTSPDTSPASPMPDGSTSSPTTTG